MQWTIRVTGKVQGVFYRKSAAEQARRIGLTGTVQNLADGSVLIHARGTDIQLRELADWCRQGPPRAVVTDLKITEEPETPASEPKAAESEPKAAASDPGSPGSDRAPSSWPADFRVIRD